MAYSTLNPPSLIAQRIGGGGGVWREARDNLRALCERDPSHCVPDDQYRD
jgi:hypothetical protein